MNNSSYISNKITLTGIIEDQYWSIRQALTFANPKYAEAQKFGRSTWNILPFISLWEDTQGGLIVPRGFQVSSFGDFTLQDERIYHPVAITHTLELRDYQAQAVHQAMIQEGGVIVAPTGSGKTVMGIALAARLGQRCLILVKSLDLAKQWQAAISQFTGLTCGLIGGGKGQEGNEFTVGLIQTLVKHPDSLDYGLCLVDECHNIPADQAYKVVTLQKARYLFGLSATPERRDGLEFMIYAALGPKVAEVPAHALNGAVLPVSVVTVKHAFSGSPESWSEFIASLERDEDRNRLLVSSAIHASQTTGTVILTTSVSHAEHLHSLVKQCGAKALLLHGQLSKAEREQGMQTAISAPLIIGTLSLLSEGIDWPHVGLIVFAAPVSASVDKATPTATRLVQSIGRARRPYPGKRCAVVLDVIDGCGFGIAAYKKRHDIYQQQGFHVQAGLEFLQQTLQGGSRH